MNESFVVFLLGLASCSLLSSLNQTFLQACIQDDPEPLSELIPVLEDLRPGFLQAIQHGSTKVVSRLLEEPSMSLYVGEYEEPLRLAASNFRFDLVSALVQHIKPRRTCELSLISLMSSNRRLLELLYPIYGATPDPSQFLRHLAFYSWHNKALPVIRWALLLIPLISAVPADVRLGTVVSAIEIALNNRDVDLLRNYLQILFSAHYSGLSKIIHFPTTTSIVGCLERYLLLEAAVAEGTVDILPELREAIYKFMIALTQEAILLPTE